jgi:hypothetical protein
MKNLLLTRLLKELKQSVQVLNTYTDKILISGSQLDEDFLNQLITETHSKIIQVQEVLNERV